MWIGESHHNTDASITSDVSVNHSGSLGGYGKIHGTVTVADGGSIAPGGSSIGTLTVGNVLFNSGSNLYIKIGEMGNDQLIASSSDSISGHGTITIENGSNLFIQAMPGQWTPNQSYIIASADNGIIGEFTTVNKDTIFLDYDVIYGANDIELYAHRNSVDFSSIGHTINQRNTAFAVEKLGSSSEIYQQVVGMNIGQALASFDSLSGEIHASAKGAILNNAQFSRDAIYNHLEGKAASSQEHQYELWIDLWGNTGSLKAYHLGAAQMKNKGFGFLVGSDLLSTQNIRLGAAIGYEENDLKVNERFSKATTKAMHLMLYGQAKIKQWSLNGGIGYSIQDLDVKRDVTVGSLYSHNTAKYDANVFQIFVKGNYHIELSDNIELSPYVTLAYQNLKTKSKTENGSITNLRIHGQSDNLLTTYLGIASKFKINDISHLSLDIAWKHNSKESYHSNMSFNDGDQFTVHGASIGKNSVVINVGGDYSLTPSSKLRIGYNGEFSGKARNNKVNFQYQYRF